MVNEVKDKGGRPQSISANRACLVAGAAPPQNRRRLSSWSRMWGILWLAALCVMMGTWFVNRPVQAQAEPDVDTMNQDAGTEVNATESDPTDPSAFDSLNVVEATLEVAILGAVRDSFTASNRPNTNYGGEENLAVGYRLSDGDPGALRTFVQFDFPGSLPTGATINRARLRMYQREATGIEEMRIVVRQPNGPWEESTLTWGNQPGFVGGERASEFISSETGFKEWDITTLAQEWKRGDTANYGIILEGLEESADNRRLFAARNAGDGNVRPVLIVDYTPAGGTIPPSSRFLHPTLNYQNTAGFRVEWTADDPTGVGIAYFDVQVREPGQNWFDWQTRTAAREAIWGGQHGRTYEFRVRAVNNAGVAEPFPENPQARTTVDLVPPVVTVNSVPPFTNQTGMLITWSATDDISGVSNYDIQVRYGDGPWIDAAIGTQQTSYFLPGREGVLAQLRVRAGDNARNLSSYDAPFATVGFTQITIQPRACILRFVPGVLPTVSPFSVSWIGQAGAGVASYDVEYRFNQGAWQPWETGVGFTTAVFTPPQGAGIYEFRVRATDTLGNRSEFFSAGTGASIRIGQAIPAPEYFFPAVMTGATSDPFLAQCRRQ